MDRIKKLKEFLQTDPHDSFVKHALALEYIKTGDETSARRLLEEVLEKDPASIGSYYQLGKLLERTGEPALALLKRRVEAEWLVLRLSGKLGSAVGAMDQTALFEPRQVSAHRRSRRVKLTGQFVHRGVAVAQQHLQDSFRALIGFCRHERYNPGSRLPCILQRSAGHPHCSELNRESWLQFGPTLSRLLHSLSPIPQGTALFHIHSILNFCYFFF